jgi:hypothetical protein
MDPAALEVALFHGEMLADCGDFRGALVQCARAAEVWPHLSLPYMHAARIYAAVLEPSTAAVHLIRAWELELGLPDHQIMAATTKHGSGCTGSGSGDGGSAAAVSGSGDGGSAAAVSGSGDGGSAAAVSAAEEAAREAVDRDELRVWRMRHLDRMAMRSRKRGAIPTGNGSAFFMEYGQLLLGQGDAEAAVLQVSILVHLFLSIRNGKGDTTLACLLMFDFVLLSPSRPCVSHV